MRDHQKIIIINLYSNDCVRPWWDALIHCYINCERKTGANSHRTHRPNTGCVVVTTLAGGTAHVRKTSRNKITYLNARRRKRAIIRQRKGVREPLPRIDRCGAGGFGEL